MKKGTKEFVSPETPLVKSAETSRIGLIVPELLFQYGDPKSHAKKFPKILPWLIPAVRGRMKGYHDLKKNPLEIQSEADGLFIEELINYAKKIGCHDVGFAELPQVMIFRDKAVLYSHAIVLSMPMDKKRMAAAPNIKAGQEVWRIYDRLGAASNKIAKFLRKRGFGAQAGAALGGDVNYPLLAQKAGMGWIGKNGLLISPEMGPSQRLAVVFTSIENLPPSRNNEYQWISDFCEKCNKCVRTCPAGAIYREKPILEDGNPRHIDYIKCAVPFSQTMGCSVCIKDCVFFSGDLKKVKL